MDYKDHVDNLHVGMYSIIESSNSPILEAFGREKVNHEIKLNSKKFIHYLQYVYQDRSIHKEIKDAKTMDQKWELAKKYSSDYKEFKKMKRANTAALQAYIGTSAAVARGALPLPIATQITGIFLFGAAFYDVIKPKIERAKQQGKQYKEFVGKDRSVGNEGENE